LGAMRSLCEGSWVVCGDFNVIRYPSERTNCSSINGAMSEFSDCIEEVELIDPPFIWRVFHLEKRREPYNCIKD